MDAKERHNRLVSYLRIKPISHGQIYTFQIAVPPSEIVEIPWERQEYLKDSFTQHGTNLIPLIVRRTEAYSEEEEYEVVYGTDVCLIAKELDIERLWVWVFDMTDEQAAVAKEEMQQLLGTTSLQEINDKPETDIGSLIEQKLKPISSKLNQLATNYTNKSETDISSLIEQKLKPISSKLNELATHYTSIGNLIDEKINPVNSVSKINELATTSIQKSENSEIDVIIQAIQNEFKNIYSAIASLSEKIEGKTKPIVEHIEDKPNLWVAEDEEIETALQKVGVNKTRRKAALAAIKYWKKLDKKLSWDSLEKSTKSGAHKIDGFGSDTYQKLKEVTVIHSMNEEKL